MKTVERIPIKNEKDLQEHALTILRRVNSDERAGLLFLLNPTYALEDAGFDLSLPMKRHIRWGLRHGTKAKARMRRLDEEISKLAGRKVQVGSDADLARLLFDELQLPLPSVAPPAPSRQAQTIARSARPGQKWQKAGADRPARRARPPARDPGHHTRSAGRAPRRPSRLATRHRDAETAADGMALCEP